MKIIVHPLCIFDGVLSQSPLYNYYATAKEIESMYDLYIESNDEMYEEKLESLEELLAKLDSEKEPLPPLEELLSESQLKEVVEILSPKNIEK